MAKRTDRSPVKKTPEASQRRPAMSQQLAMTGLRTSHDFANIMGALFTDVVLGTISPDVCNAACNAGGKLLQVIALQQKYGSRGTNGTKTLMLTHKAA